MRNRFGTLTAALLATTALGLGVLEVSTDREARRQVNALVAQGHGLGIGGVSAEPLRGRVVLRNVTMGRGAVRLSIGRLALHAPHWGFSLVGSALADEQKATPPAAGPKAALTGTASADDVTIVKGTTTYRIKRIELTGTSLSNADVAALLDTNSAEPVEARLKKLNATSIVMPDVVADDATPGSERHATFQQVALSGVVAGHVTAGSVGGIVFAVKSGDDALDGTTGAIQFFGANLPQLARILGTTRTDDAEPLQTVYDSVTANAIKVGNGNGGLFTLATLKETNLKGRPFKTDWAKAQKDNAGKPSPAEQAALLDDFKQSVAIGTAEMIDLSAKGDDAKAPQLFSIADFTMHDFAKGSVGGMGLRDIRFGGPAVKVGLGTLDIGPFALPTPKLAPGSPAATNAMLPSTIKVDLSKLAVDVAPKEDSGDTNHFVLNVARAGYAGEGDAGDIPKSSKLSIENVVFDLPPGNPGAQPLVDMGYGHLDLSAAMNSSYDPSSQELDLRNLTLKGANMGSVGVGLQLVNVTKGIISPNKEIAKASMVAILVKGLSLDVVNEGFVDRLLAWRAKEDGMTVADEKAFVVDLVTNKLPASFNSANVKTIGAAVAKFVDKPKTLHIDIKSKNGLGIGSMSMLADPAMLIDTLDVKATANE